MEAQGRVEEHCSASADLQAFAATARTCVTGCDARLAARGHGSWRPDSACASRFPLLLAGTAHPMSMLASTDRRLRPRARQRGDQYLSGHLPAVKLISPKQLTASAGA